MQRMADINICMSNYQIEWDIEYLLTQCFDEYELIGMMLISVFSKTKFM